MEISSLYSGICPGEYTSNSKNELPKTVARFTPWNFTYRASWVSNSRISNVPFDSHPKYSPSSSCHSTPESDISFEVNNREPVASIYTYAVSIRHLCCRPIQLGLSGLHAQHSRNLIDYGLQIIQLIYFEFIKGIAVQRSFDRSALNALEFHVTSLKRRKIDRFHAPLALNDPVTVLHINPGLGIIRYEDLVCIGRCLPADDHAVERFLLANMDSPLLFKCAAKEVNAYFV